MRPGADVTDGSDLRAIMGSVATRLQHDQRFPSDPTTVMTMLRDPAFIELKCQRTGSLETTATIEDTADGGCVITSTRVLPSQVPAAARSFVGDTITVTEVQTWTAPGADGSATATVTVDFAAPMAFAGTLTMSPDGEATTVRTDGEFKASVPFVGKSIEKSVAEQTAKYLTVEETVGGEWLSR